MYSVQDLWDRIADAPDEVELTEAQRADLDQISEAHRADPDGGSSWEEVRDRIRSRQ
ncbi:MAG: addiction module protein [Planctomycetes bacterium]|nr:addiction module protein [Planctomycetota bacterium]